MTSKAVSFSLNRPLLAIFALFALIACQPRQKAPLSDTRIIIDMAGREVEIPIHVERAFIDRHSVMMVYAVDTTLMVNRVFEYTETEKKYLKPSFYEGKPYVIEGVVEEIINLKPDIVIYSQFITPENIAMVNNLQEKIQLPVILMDMDITKYKEILTFLGDVLGKEEKTNELVDFIQTYIDPVLAKAKTIPQEQKKTIYYAEGMKGLQTDPSGSVHSLLIDLLGGINIAQTDVLPGKGMSAVSLEQLYVWQPEIILVWSGNHDGLDSYKEIKANSAWHKLNAVKNNRVYQVPWRPFGWIDRPPGINRLIGLVWLSNLLYPEIYGETDLVAITQEFFWKFDHYEMTEEEALELLNPQP
ncbi:iron complex transport system substrate-binding protein [termite gut metagenome]|uniref:Iron complex transport system substrate-binding protein n=1 Tax=termite gut metagenome TaxID=433724 RepID=A0A5J4QYA4_9ZZZZ